MHKILVTGANGFVGNAIYMHLINNNNYEIIGSARNPNNDRLTASPSLSANANWFPLLSGCNTVIHTAGRAHILKDRDPDSLSTFREINTTGTLTLAKQAADAGVQRFIFISSIGVNGSTCNMALTEQTEPSPTDPYAISKFEAENGLWDIVSQYPMEVVIIRPTLIYGPGAVGNFSILLKAIQKNLPLPLGKVTNKRTFLGIDNLIDLIQVCIHHPAAANQLYLVGDSEIVSTPDLIKALGICMGHTTHLVPLPISLVSIFAKMIGKKRQFDKLTGDLWINSSKAKIQLGWTPPHTQLDGLKSTVKHFLDSRF
jgi:nucleoside-diphosphate-sugar epimerase